MKTTVSIVMTAILALSLTACGGGSSVSTNNGGGPGPTGGTTPPPAKVGGVFGYMPGFGASHSTIKTASNEGPLSTLGMFLLRFSGNDPVISLSGTYTGLCDQIGDGSASRYYYHIYGMTTNQPNCTELTTLPTVPDLMPVIGPGTLTGLVAYGVGPTSVSDTDDGKVIVTVNGQVTSLSCTLGTGPRCEATGTVTVNDNDLIGAVVYVGTDMPIYKNLRVIIVKE